MCRVRVFGPAVDHAGLVHVYAKQRLLPQGRVPAAGECCDAVACTTSEN